MKIRRQLTAAGVMAALVLGNLLLTARASAQAAGGAVLDQVPSDALVAFKIKNLNAFSGKVAKMAKDLGLDQMSPEFADPIGAMEEISKISKGVNKAGDLAFVFLDPKIAGGDDAKSVLVLVPVSDFKAFVGNFKEAAPDGAVTKAKSPEGDETVYIAQWGGYAAVSPTKDALAKKAGVGLKLQGAATKEGDAKDVLLFANVPALKTKFLPELKDNRAQLIDQVDGLLAMAGEGGKKFSPVLKAVVGQGLNMAEEFLTDARSATIGLNLTDAGLTATVMADFTPGTYLGNLAAESKNTDAPLIVGLPDRKYFAYAGGIQEPKQASKLIADLIDPIAKELSKVEGAAAISKSLDSWKKATAATTGYSIAYVAPTGAPGQESVMQQIAVLQGDAAAIQAAQREGLAAMNEIMALMPQQGGGSVKFSLKPDAGTVAGVKVDVFETQMKFPDNDPNAAQAKKMMEFVYGPNGMKGVMGQAGPKALVLLQGAPDALASETFAAAKAGKPAAANAGVAAVTAQLPKSRSAVVFIELDNVLNTAITYLQAQLPMKINQLPELPPIGVTAGTEQTALRFDAVIPMELVKGLVAAGIQAQKQAANPNGGL